MSLFIDPLSQTEASKSDRPSLISTVIEVAPQSLAPLSELPEVLHVNTPAGVFRVERTAIELRGKDSFMWAGRTNEGELGSVVFTMANGVLFGYIGVGNEVLSVEPGENGPIMVRKANLPTGLLSDDVLIPPSPISESQAEAPADQQLPESGAQIDVLILYTPTLYGRYSSQLAGMIQSYFDVANTCYTNSGIQTRIRLVGSLQYTGTTAVEGVSGCDAVSAFTSDAVVASLRNQYKADVVCLLRLFNDASCGCGWIMTTVSQSFAPYGFSVVEVRPASDANPYYCQDTTLAHEIGHNMGCAHDRDHASTGGAYSYSYGYDVPGVLATVMSYDVPRILFFSTPSKSYFDHPVGIDAAFPNSADNTKTINNTRAVVANFRVGSSVDLAINQTISASLVVGQEAEYELTVRNVGGVPTSATITVNNLLPAGLAPASYIGTGWNCSAGGQTVTCTRTASIPAAEQSTITIQASVGSAALPAVTNNVTLSSTEDSNPANNSASMTNPVFVGTTGYTMLGADGGIFNFGASVFHGSLPALGVVLNAPTTILKHSADEGGYYLMGLDGGMFAFGTAAFFGSLPSIGIANTTIDMEVSPSGSGYQLLGIDGGIFAFGDAPFYGSLPSIGIVNTALDMERTPSGQGYWILGIDGGIFAFGDAQFWGSLPQIGIVPNSPLKKIKSTPTGRGYYLLGEDGGLFAFGDAAYFGSLPQLGVVAQAVDLEVDARGLGYYILTNQGRVCAFGSLPHFGTLADFGVHVDNVMDMDLNRR